MLPGTFLDEMARNFDRGTRDAALRLYRACRHFPDMAEVLAMTLRNHRYPALVIWGGRDHYLLVAQAELQRKAFPDAKVVVLPESGHWPMIDNAPAVETAVTEFLRPLLTAGAAPADRPASAAH